MSKRKAPVTNRRTSPGHSKVPIAEATSGKLYRVRDKGWVKVWGENLTWHEAKKLKNSVAAKRLSRTVRIEDMAVPPDLANPVQDGIVDIAVAQEKAVAAVRRTLAKTNLRSVVKLPVKPLVADLEFELDIPDGRSVIDDGVLTPDAPSDDDIDAAIEATK